MAEFRALRNAKNSAQMLLSRHLIRFSYALVKWHMFHSSRMGPFQEGYTRFEVAHSTKESGITGREMPNGEFRHESQISV